MERQILIVEYATRPSEELREWAKHHAISTYFAESGSEALRWLGRGNIPDLVMAEAEMEDMLPVRFVQQLKEIGFFQDIPIVAFGNPEKHETMASMLRAGAADHLIRPFSQEEIQSRTHRFLSGHPVV